MFEFAETDSEHTFCVHILIMRCLLTLEFQFVIIYSIFYGSNDVYL